MHRSDRSPNPENAFALAGLRREALQGGFCTRLGTTKQTSKTVPDKKNSPLPEVSLRPLPPCESATPNRPRVPAPVEPAWRTAGRWREKPDSPALRGETPDPKPARFLGAAMAGHGLHSYHEQPAIVGMKPGKRQLSASLNNGPVPEALAPKGR